MRWTRPDNMILISGKRLACVIAMAWILMLAARSASADPGIIVIGGDVVFGFGSLVAIEIGGTTPGFGPDDHDQFQIGGQASLGGTLELLLINGFEDSIATGDRFTILTTGDGIVGDWLNVQSGQHLGVTTGPGTFLVSYGAGSPFDPNNVVLSEFTLPTKTATWNGGDGNWSLANWTFAPADLGDPDFPNNAGARAYNVTVGPPGTVTVDQDIEINDLTLVNNGRIHLDNDLEATRLNWDHQTSIEGGGTITVGGGEISGRFSRTLNSTLRNTGLLTWSGGSVASTGGAFINAEGAQLDITVPDFTRFFSPITVTNEPGATIRRDGSGTAIVEGQLDNAGLIQVDSGTLELDRGVSTGEFVVNNGGTLQFDVDGAATHTISGALRTTLDPDNPTDPAPIISFIDGATVVTGTYHAGDSINPGVTVIRSGDGTTRLEYNNVDEPATTSVLELRRGALGGTGDFEAGTLTWDTGKFDGSGTITVGGGEIRSDPNTGLERKLLTTLRNTGLLIWSGGGVGRSTDAAGSFINAEGAEFDITLNGLASFVANITVTNEPGATIRRNGSGIASLLGAVSNAGDVEAVAGTLTLGQYTQTAGVTRVLAGATIASSQTMNFQGGRVEGDGRFNATINLSNTLGTAVLAPGASAGTLSTGNLSLGDGTTYEWELDDTGMTDSVDVNGSLTFGTNATLVLIDAGGTPDPNTEYVLFSYTGSDPMNANWTIDVSLVPEWDVTGVTVTVDFAGDRVVLSGVLERCSWTNTSGGSWDTVANWSIPPSTSCLATITPDVGLTVFGPAATTSIHRLKIGAQTAGVALLSLQNGTLQVTDTVTIDTRGRLAGTGTLVATGGVENRGEIDLGGGLQILGGTLDNHGLVRGDGAIESTLNNTVFGEVRAESGQRIAFTGPGNTNDGQVNLFNATVEFAQDMTNNASGFISGSGALIAASGLDNHGTLSFSGTTHVIGDVDNHSTGQIVISGTGGTTFHDDVVNDGSIVVLAASNVTFFGSFSGSQGTTGTGTVFLSGDLQPGNSPASIRFGGDVHLGSTATTQIELGGAIAGSEYDQIIIDGELSLGGTLDVTLINGFEPQPGDQFAILSYGALSGTFETINMPTLSSGVPLSFNFTEGGLAITVTSLPGDHNGDGVVGLIDLSIVQAGLGAEFDRSDVASIVRNLGAVVQASPAESLAVPEPTALTLAALALVGRSFRWRRRRR